MSNMDGGMDSELDGFLRRVAVRQSECKFCGIKISFSERVAYEEDGREHRCLSRATPAAKSYSCNRCAAPITFKDRKPMNPNGSPHRCIAESRAASRATSVDPSTGEIFGLGA